MRPISVTVPELRRNRRCLFCSSKEGTHAEGDVHRGDNVIKMDSECKLIEFVCKLYIARQVGCYYFFTATTTMDSYDLRMQSKRYAAGIAEDC